MPRYLDPPWVATGRKYLGIREIPGNKHNPTILRWWVLARVAIRNDEDAWCAGSQCGILEESGFVSPRKANARSFLKWGVSLDKPAVGAIVVFWRGSPFGWQGHVGTIVGVDAFDNLMVMGGNQGDAYCIKPFTRERVLGYRWPADYPPPGYYKLPVLKSDGRVSRNEA